MGQGVLMKFCQYEKKKKSFWPTNFTKQIGMHRCKSWMHVKDARSKAIKLCLYFNNNNKSHKAFSSPADLDNLLGSRQGDGTVRVSAR